MNLPKSVLVKHQKITKAKIIGNQKIVVEIRYDDECSNGHNSFAITADEFELTARNTWRWSNGGMQHELVAKFFPELAKYLKWHLTGSDGPMHYVANTKYHAGDKDCWGGRAGDVRAYRYNVRTPINGSLVLSFPKGQEYKYIKKEEAEKMIERIGGELVPVPWLLHEGKERDLDAARCCAVWPDATDEELMADDLEEKLLARLPALMEEFKKNMEELGFTY